MTIYGQPEFYVYQLRLETSDLPFYIGKGKGNRISRHLIESEMKRISLKNKIIKNAEKEKINIIKEKLYVNLTEQEAFDLEMHEIAMHGRIDIGTGYLANMTDGLDGVSGLIHSDKTKQQISKNLKFSLSLRTTEDKIKNSEKLSTAAKNMSLDKKLKKSNKLKSIHAKRSDKEKCKIGNRISNSWKQMDADKKKLILAARSGTNHWTSDISVWEHSRCTAEQLIYIWGIADEIYNLYLSGYNTKNKLENYFELCNHRFVTIIKKFKEGWIPNDDVHWVSRFKNK